jgi:hypothetical protein
MTENNRRDIQDNDWQYLVIPESPKDLSGIPWFPTFAWIQDNRFALSVMMDYIF